MGLLGGAFVAAPFASRGQAAAIPRIGFLNSGSPAPFAHLVDAFRGGLDPEGFRDGRNIAIDYRWADGEYERLPGLARELIGRRVAVLVATGGVPSALAAKAATATTPVVFAGGFDPIKLGLVTSLNRPGGNVTGVSILTGQLEAKRMGLLREAVPNAPLITILINPSNPGSAERLKEIEEAARGVGQAIQVLRASSRAGINMTFEMMGKSRPGALLVGADAFFYDNREQLVALAARQAIPAAYEQREFAVIGGLMSYGTSLAGGYRQVGSYVGRVLKGEKPADLPVIQSSRFEFVVNLRTARVLGITMPESILARADEVVE